MNIGRPRGTTAQQNEADSASIPAEVHQSKAAVDPWHFLQLPDPRGHCKKLDLMETPPKKHNTGTKGGPGICPTGAKRVVKPQRRSSLR